MKRIYFSSLFMLAIQLFTFSQGIGIGTTTPHASAIVDISTASKGLLIPRMTTAAINSISNPAKGLLIYDSVKNQLMVNMGSSVTPSWQSITTNSSWGLTGNAGTDPSTSFIGTTDAVALEFRVSNQKSGHIGLGTDFNTFFGARSGAGTGTSNTGFGTDVLSNTTTGFNNVGIGNATLRDNTSGQGNIAIGGFALEANTTGSSNIAIGSQALKSSTGNSNIAIGNAALTDNVESFNTAIGSLALWQTTNSQFNTAVGYHAAAGFNLGYNNTILGANCGVDGDGFFNCIAIGQAVTCTASSQARIGNLATNSIGGYANWTNFSDGRYKKNIQENVKGIDFIMKLRPITYQLDVAGLSNKLNESGTVPMNAAMQQAMKEKEIMIFSGFVAQEVEVAAKQLQYDFSGVDAPKNANDFYGLRYADFVVPLTKAAQEQQAIINEQKEKIASLERRLQALEEQIKMLVASKSK